MALFPASTNADYEGARISLFILGLAAIITLIPACIHAFLPDGGANLIAGLGLDLTSEHGRQIVRLFAWAGITQLVWGLLLLTVLMKYRSLVPLALALLTAERALHCLHMWGPKSGEHHPPEAYATLILIPLFALGFILSVRTPK